MLVSVRCQGDRFLLSFGQFVGHVGHIAKVRYKLVEALGCVLQRIGGGGAVITAMPGERTAR
jgi:hypothetical protein